MSAKVCRHCKRKNVNRPRGLCWPCYYTPGVKDLYPSTSKYARRGVGHHSASTGVPVPTAAPPGSLDKLKALADRAAAGLELHAAGDKANYEDVRDHAAARSDNANGDQEVKGDVQEARRNLKGAHGPRFVCVSQYSIRNARRRGRNDK